MSHTTRTRTARALIALAAGATLLLTGCGTVTDALGAAIGQNTPAEVRDSTTGAVVEAGTTDVFQIKVGDCIIDSAGDTVSEVENVPCSEPHDYEVYFHGTLTVDTLPSDINEVYALGDEICAPEFEKFVGIPYTESELGFSHFTPTDGSWADGDRAVDCLIYGDGLVTGSLAGAQR